MNNEPVKKFMDKITDTSEIPFAMATLDKNGDIKEFGPYQIDFAHEIPHIPLYTHPAKTLTDEEIYKIANSIETIQPQHGLKLSNDLNVMEFARAILKKAQDK